MLTRLLTFLRGSLQRPRVGRELDESCSTTWRWRSSSMSTPVFPPLSAAARAP